MSGMETASLVAELRLHLADCQIHLLDIRMAGSAGTLIDRLDRELANAVMRGNDLAAAVGVAPVVTHGPPVSFAPCCMKCEGIVSDGKVISTICPEHGTLPAKNVEALALGG
jgi:hypothetical protein